MVKFGMIRQTSLFDISKPSPASRNAEGQLAFLQILLSLLRQHILNLVSTFLLAESQDRTVKKWEIARNHKEKKDSRKAPRALYTRKAHDKDINALSTNHNSTLFAFVSQDRRVKVWPVEGGDSKLSSAVTIELSGKGPPMFKSSLQPHW